MPTVRQHLREIIAAIECGYVPAEFREPLIEYLSASVVAAEGRRNSALLRTQERSERKRQAVRDTAKHLLTERPGLSPSEVETITHRRLRTLGQPVSRRIVHDEIASRFGTETTRALCHAVSTEGST